MRTYIIDKKPSVTENSQDSMQNYNFAVKQNSFITPKKKKYE